MAVSPLEQFAIIPLVPIHIGNFSLSFTNSSFFMLLTTGLVLLLVRSVTLNGGHLIPNAWQSLRALLERWWYTLLFRGVGGLRSALRDAPRTNPSLIFGSFLRLCVD